MPSNKFPVLKCTQPAFRPVVFLDFDGVTHPDRARSDRHFEAVPLIEAVLRDFLEVDVVLSTSWRENYPLDELRHLFSRDIAERIIDITPIYTGERSWPDLPFMRAARVRHGEIQVWLHENRSIDHPWIALDDRPSWFDEGAPVLATDMTSGFTPADALTLRARLKAFRRQYTFSEVLETNEICHALGNITEEKLAARIRRGHAYRVDGGYPSIQSWPGIAGEPLAKCIAALNHPKGSDVDQFFKAPDEFLGDLTPVEVLLGRVLSTRPVGALAQEILEQPVDRRLAIVLMACTIALRHQV